MTFKDILHKFRSESFTEKEKGTKFERLMKSWLLSDPRYNQIKTVWLWDEFPGKKDFGGKDIGIDLVAKTELGEYWAVQCKCYDENAVINKPAVDSFLSTSSKTFTDAETFQTVFFSHRLWISTTNHWGDNAIEAVTNQNPPVSIVNLIDLQISTVDWAKLLEGVEGHDALIEGKKLFKHQLNAISEAYTYYQDHDRGKLIMACGTGKTFTSLRMVETLCHDKGLILFMVPSIALLGQSLNAWMADAKKPIKAVCICSDNKASKKIEKDLDNPDSSVIDLALPATTNAKSVARQLEYYHKKHDGLIVVFSTYQSVDAVSEAQQKVLKDTNGEFGEFDFIICDEAHRTTGVKLPDAADESAFTKIHSNDNVKGKKRLYMTATPRLYGSSAKIKASQKDCILCSMDDESIYGKEFFRVNFSYAVQNGLLTDYKVFVLTVSEDELADEIQEKISDSTIKEYNFDDTPKLIGVINGLSKIMLGDEGKTWEADPRIMHRAVAFCHKIGNSSDPGTSKNVTKVLPEISQMIDSKLSNGQKEHVVSVTTKHIDGSMNSQERNEILNWLREESDDPRECRVVTNVRCLSEGVDVPALDAVLFLSARNSQVDVVQSVGRVMRNFRKGRADEKKYGYIIIPIVVPQGVKAEDALNDNKTFEVVWQILNALRSHDDAFNAEVNKIALNTKKSSKVMVGNSSIGTKINYADLASEENEYKAIAMEDGQVAKQLSLKFGQYQDGIYAKLVEKCGDRMYWENWAKEVGQIAQKFIERIARLVSPGCKYEKEFDTFLKGLQKNLNPSVDTGQAIEMLAQHMVSRPVFDALFADYKFVDNNTVSRSMQAMIEILKDEAFEKDTVLLDKFYQSVRINVGDIDNLEGKQTIIKNLYEKFFKGAFPKTVDQLGIVYTPVECVDFIIHSVDAILRKEFNTSLTEENVHILDPFTGTGTFITRLLQSGLIRKEDLERKYRNEIHCNELVLLAYYIADVNIESVFHSLVKRDEYLPYDGICLTDTFYTSENQTYSYDNEYLNENIERIKTMKKRPIKVIIGNPPYSVGQKSANDNAKNLSYPNLDGRIAKTYVAGTNATNKNSLYDSYIKAFRWSSDRIESQEDGGIVAFISNGGWLDGNAQDGFRKCLEEEFTDIYILNLRGNCRTSGELRRKEGDGVFGLGSRTPITMTFLIRNPKKHGKATIYYHDIGDYLTREQKLDMVKEFGDVRSPKLDWQIIKPNEKNDWINQRGGNFEDLFPIFPDVKFDSKARSFFSPYSLGIVTAKDQFLYNTSKEELKKVVENMVNYYNSEVARCKEEGDSYEPVRDGKNIVWTDSFLKDLSNYRKYSYEEQLICDAYYRPFFKQKLYYKKEVIERTYQHLRLFPDSAFENIMICVPSAGGSKDFAAIMTDKITDRGFNSGTQCLPLYYYEENKATQLSLFDSSSNEKYIRRDGITDWILRTIRTQYGTRIITKEMIFYYVYGLLHSEDYRTAFEADLKKSLPRIPIVDKLEDFIAFEKAGEKLAKLHLNYEDVDPCPGVKVDMTGSVDDPYEYYKVVDKMRFAKKQDAEKCKKVDDKSTIIYNSHIVINNIPSEAYDYVVNGKSAIEWLLERYAVTVDKKSLIKNDCNDWSREHHQPRYILDLMLSVINVSVQTVDIVKNLPMIKFE